MSLLESIAGKSEKGWRFVPSKPGWVGIDIGTQSIKLAQVQRVGQHFRIRSRWTLPADNNTALSRDEVRNGNLARRLAAIKSLRRMFVGRECAATLPMTLADMRSFDIPFGDAQEQRSMVAEELAADLAVEPSDLAFGCWQVASDGEEGSTMSRISAMAVPQDIAVRLATDLLATGLECHVLNAIPCALARAVELADPAQADEPVAAIDLGYASAQLVIVHGGRPMFSRVLRGGNLQTMMQPLESGLNLSSEECQQLLVRYGVPAPGQPVSVGAQATVRLIAHPLDMLVSEIDRTLGYVGQQFRELKPRRIWLFGGGATIHNLPAHLTEKVQLPTSSWKLGDEGSDSSDALYGVSAALSSLFWESRTCM